MIRMAKHSIKESKTDAVLQLYSENVKTNDNELQSIPNHVFEDLDVSGLNTRTIEAIQEIRSEIDTTSSMSILNFGTNASEEFMEFSSLILENFSARDIPNIMELVQSMEGAFSSINKQALMPKQGILRLFHDRSMSTEEFISRYNNAADIVDQVKIRLNQIDFELMHDIEIDRQFGLEVIKLIRSLEYHILAAKMALRDLKESCKLAQSEDNQTSLSGYFEMEQKDNIDRLERKIYNLNVQKVEAIQTLPILSQMVKSSEKLSEQIKNAIQQGIPTWEKSILIAIHLYRQQSAIKSEKALRDITNNLIQQNASTLRSNCESIAKAVGKGLIDVDALEKANSEIFETAKSLNSIISDEAKIRQEQMEKLNEIQRSVNQIGMISGGSLNE